MIGRKHADHCVSVISYQDERRQADCRRGIAAHRLGDDLCFPKFWKLTRDFSPEIFIGNHPESAAGCQRQETRHRLLDHGLLAIQREQLLGAALAT